MQLRFKLWTHLKLYSITTVPSQPDSRLRRDELVQKVIGRVTRVRVTTEEGRGVAILASPDDDLDTETLYVRACPRPRPCPSVRDVGTFNFTP